MALGKIATIKVIRAVTGLSLRGAKDVADALFNATSVFDTYQAAIDEADANVAWAEARSAPQALLDVLYERQSDARNTQWNAFSGYTGRLTDDRIAREQSDTDKSLAELRAKLTGC